MFQPYEVRSKHLFNYSVKKSDSQFFIKHVQKERLKGVAQGKIRLPTKLGKLRVQNPAWSVKGVDFLNFISSDDMKSPSIEASTWKICRTEPWNISYECITSTPALNDWFRSFSRISR